MSRRSRFQVYADGMDPARAVFVQVRYQTNAGDAGVWSRNTEAGSFTEAMDAACAHVGHFRYVMKVYGADAVAAYAGQFRGEA